MSKGAQTAALTGEPGDAGSVGPSGSMAGAGGWVAVDGGVVSLAVPMSCEEGSVIKQVAGGFACMPDDPGAIAGVASLVAGPGVQVSSPVGALTLSAPFGETANDVSRGEHWHDGVTWRGTIAGRGFSVINQLEDDPYFPDLRLNPDQHGIFAQVTSGTPGTDFAVVDPVYHAAIIGRNTASGGAAVIGDSRAGGFGAGRVGAAGYAGDAGSTQTAGVYGRGVAGAMGVHAFANQASTIALNATNRDLVGPRVALQTSGVADLSGASIRALFEVYENAGSNWADCANPNEEIAIAGSCDVAGDIYVRCLVGPSGLCMSNGQNVSQHPTRFYCAASAIPSYTRVVCVKTALL